MKGVLTENSVHHFLICVFYVAHITAETVLVKLFVRGRIPKSAGVGRNLIRKNYFAVGSFAEFNLKVDKVYVYLFEEVNKEFVDFECIVSSSCCVA